ncbi:TetR/AcrR family transcriptional regulator [Arthrobacter rhombi]|uniref:TetR/AcrR family transcriptional regulator n=1 Tax=Arthrobacter rhombi TaxID=71253 RepID=UPI003FD076D3
MSVDTRNQIIDSSLRLLRRGSTVSLESAARQAGLTKPGLMYHFRTKEALMLGLVDAVLDQWVVELSARLGAASEQASAVQRVAAYLEWTLERNFDASDLVMLTDPRLRDPLTERWSERFGPWFAVPDGASAALRGRLAAVRLLADGIWFASATDILPPAQDELETIRTAAVSLLEDQP